MSLRSFFNHRFLATGIVTAFMAALLLAGCGSSSSANTSPTATTPPAPTATTAATATSAPSATVNPSSNVAVTIQSFAFSPQTLTIKTGTKVTWTDMDNVAHTVSSDSGPASFDSGALTPSGGTFSFTFSQAGTYTYHCKIHPSMTATIVVVS